MILNLLLIAIVMINAPCQVCVLPHKPVCPTSEIAFRGDKNRGLSVIIMLGPGAEPASARYAIVYAARSSRRKAPGLPGLHPQLFKQGIPVAFHRTGAAKHFFPNLFIGKLGTGIFLPAPGASGTFPRYRLPRCCAIACQWPSPDSKSLSAQAFAGFFPVLWDARDGLW